MYFFSLNSLEQFCNIFFTYFGVVTQKMFALNGSGDPISNGCIFIFLIM